MVHQHHWTEAQRACTRLNDMSFFNLNKVEMHVKYRLWIAQYAKQQLLLLPLTLVSQKDPTQY